MPAAVQNLTLQGKEGAFCVIGLSYWRGFDFSTYITLIITNMGKSLLSSQI